MTDTKSQSGDDSEWVVETGAPLFPADVMAATMASHASLAEKLVELRSLSQPFLATAGPAAGDRWIDGASEHGPDESAPS